MAIVAPLAPAPVDHPKTSRSCLVAPYRSPMVGVAFCFRRTCGAVCGAPFLLPDATAVGVTSSLPLNDPISIQVKAYRLRSACANWHHLRLMRLVTSFGWRELPSNPCQWLTPKFALQRFPNVRLCGPPFANCARRKRPCRRRRNRRLQRSAKPDR
jgi:hypothetical protein